MIVICIFVSTGKVVALYSRFDVIVSLFYTFIIKNMSEMFRSRSVAPSNCMWHKLATRGRHSFTVDAATGHQC